MAITNSRLSRPFEPGTWWLPVPAVLLLVPFLNYAKSNAYPLLTAEITLLAAVLLALGLVLGAIGRIHRVIGASVVAGALTLLIDVQTRWFFDLSLHQYVWIPIGLFLIVLLLPKATEPAVLVLVYAMLVAVVATPRSEPIAVRRAAVLPDGTREPGAGSPNSYWIHVIVDEHIGIESIPLKFDPNRRLTSRIRDDYVSDGFIVFGRAFTRFSQTHLSVPNIFNFSEKHPVSLLADAGALAMAESSYLERLHQMGFGIQIFESDYLGLCEAAQESWTLACQRYGGNTIWGVHGTTLPITDKAILIIRMYARLSKIYGRFASLLSDNPWLSTSQSVAPLVGMKIMTRFEERLLSAEPGSAFIIHVMQPHAPYALESDCTIRSLPWQDSGNASETAPWNTPEQRSVKYPLYLEQLACTHRIMQDLFEVMKTAGIYLESNIVVHGDHGSRIALQNLRDRPSYTREILPSARTLVDYQGTLFAFKPAGRSEGEYRREMAAVSTLLDRASSGTLADEVVDEPEAHMNLVEWDASCTRGARTDIAGCRLLPVPMPHFSHGTTGEQANAR